MKKLSVIIPIYNAENYLPRCLKNLMNQTMRDIEFILIDDGSQDNSLEVCKEYARIDSRLRVVSQKNQGVSAARNKGIELASAPYIAFMDPDDELDKNMYENMYFNMMRSECDICICNYSVVGGGRHEVIKLPYSEGIYGKKHCLEIIKNMISPISLDQEPIMGSVWRSVYKLSIIKENKIQFPLNIRPMQDLVFMVQYLLTVSSLYIDEHAYYIYYINSNSAMTSYKKNLWKNNQIVFKFLNEIINNQNLENQFNKNLERRWLHIMLSSLSNELHIDNKTNIITQYRKIKEISKHKNSKQIFNNINPDKMGYKNKFLFYGLKYNAIFMLIFAFKIYRLKTKLLK